MEAAAIMKIILLSRLYGYTIYGSATLEAEIGANPDIDKRMDVQDLYRRTVNARANYDDSVFSRMTPIARKAGVRGYDVFHICYAIAAGADYLLTTDTDFLKTASKLTLPLSVINPLTFRIGGVI